MDGDGTKEIGSLKLSKVETSIHKPNPQSAQTAEKGLGILQQVGVINKEATGLGVDAALLVQPEPDLGAIQNMEVYNQIKETGQLGRLKKVGERNGALVMEDPENGQRITLRLGASSEGENMAAPTGTFTHPNLDRFMYQRERTNISGFSEQERGAMVDVINAIPAITPDQGFDLVRLANARIDLQAAVSVWTNAYWDWDANHDRTSKKYLEQMQLFAIYNGAFLDGDPVTMSATRRLIQEYPGVEQALNYIQHKPHLGTSRDGLTEGYWTSPADANCVSALVGLGIDTGTASVATQLAKKLIMVSGEAKFPDSHFPNLHGVPGFQSQARIEAVQDLGKNLAEMLKVLFK